MNNLQEARAFLLRRGRLHRGHLVGGMARVSLDDLVTFALEHANAEVERRRAVEAELAAERVKTAALVAALENLAAFPKSSSPSRAIAEMRAYAAGEVVAVQGGRR